MSIEIIPVSNPAQWQSFLALPQVLYTHSELEKLISVSLLERKFRKKYNPFLAHINWAAFIARKQSEVIGRIVASIDYLWPDQTAGFFGFLECIEEPATCQKLLAAASAWLVAHKRTQLIGPVNLSTSDNLGCLVEGFNGPNPFYLPYNPSYYDGLLRDSGLLPLRDLYSYTWQNSQVLSERITKIGTRLEKSTNAKVRPINYSQLQREALAFYDIYNQAMVKNWGHVPLTMDEAEYILSSHQKQIPPEYFLFAKVEGAPAGVCLGLPHFPSHALRLMLLAVKPEYHHLGLSALLITAMLQRANEDNLTQGELSFVQEDNNIVNKLIRQDVGSSIAKRYRLYQLNLR